MDVQAATDWLGTSAGALTAVSVIATSVVVITRWMSSAYKILVNVHNELVPNSGGSLRDAINRIEALAQAGLQLTDKAYWLSAPDGSCTYSSNRLAAMMGVAPGQVLGWGWVTSLSLKDRESCRHEWDAAVEDRREFHMRYSFTRPDGGVVPVIGHAIPVIHTPSGVCTGMIGWAEEDAGGLG